MNSTQCPVAETAKLIGDTTSLLIIKSLLHEEKRYKAIRAYVTQGSEVTLANRLKTLQEQGFIIRTQHDEMPPRVTYKLTAKGQALSPIIAAMQQFGETYL